MHARRSATALALAALVGTWSWGVAAQAPASGADVINPDELRTWLTYFASDELEGRATFSEGLGLAGAFIADHLQSWDVSPGGDDGTYFRRVKVLDVKATSHSTLTVEVGGRKRTFADGEGVTFPRFAGGRQTVTLTDVEFVGYGLRIPELGHDNYANRDVAGKAVIWMGTKGPKGLEGQQYRRALYTRNSSAISTGRAAAVIGPPVASPWDSGKATGGGTGQSGSQGTQANGKGGESSATSEFTTAQRLDTIIAPSVSAGDEFYEFLFGAAGLDYADLSAKAERQERLPEIALKNVTLTFDIDADYTVVNARYSRNIVGIIQGSDPVLKDTYVALGAHYDHVGYREGTTMNEDTPDGGGDPNDRIWNGADDNGSGSMAILAVAKAFMQSARPKRSILLVWHAGEERGLWGSRSFVDAPAVPLDAIVAQLNMDMVGRNRDNKEAYANTVFLVGSDRISTELHNINEDANAGMARPLVLDYEYNDPADSQSLYTRSDHYSYALKGIPVIFYTTGLHPDYHQNTDSADRIDYEKMARVAQLAYLTASHVADRDTPPARDNKGPRVGKGQTGRLED
jgi:hypothetical protein